LIPSPFGNKEEITVEKEDRRNHLLQTLKGEYIVTHRNEVTPQYAASNEPPPTIWANRRLYELGEKWAIGIPASVTSLSNDELRQQSLDLGRAMVGTEAAWHRGISAVMDKYIEDGVADHLKGDFSHDGERRNKETKETEELTTTRDVTYENLYHVKARDFRNELVRRIGEPSMDRLMTIEAEAVLDRGMLAGPYPLSGVAAYLQALSEQLPLSKTSAEQEQLGNTQIASMTDAQVSVIKPEIQSLAFTLRLVKIGSSSQSTIARRELLDIFSGWKIRDVIVQHVTTDNLPNGNYITSANVSSDAVRKVYSILNKYGVELPLKPDAYAGGMPLGTDEVVIVVQ